MTEIIQSLLKNRITLVVLLVLSIFPYVYYIFFAPISIDGSYYLSVIERIREGLTPYRDFTLEYTPVFLYLTAGVKSIFSVGVNYSFDLGFHFVIVLCTTYLLYKIALAVLQNNLLSIYAAIFYLLISFWIVQYEFILEIPSLFWGLLAIYLTLNKNFKPIFFVTVGIASALSFLTKQYGLGFFFLISYLLVIDFQWKKFFFFCTGFVIPILFFAFWIPEIITIFDGNGYGSNAVDSSEGIWGVGVLKRLATASVYFLVRVPILAVAILLFPVIPEDKRKVAGLFLLGLAGFMLQFVFAIFNHYALYIIPFAVLYIFLILNSIKSKSKTSYFYYLLLILVFCASLFKNYQRIIGFDTSIRDKQITLADKIRPEIEPGKNLYIADTRLVDLYYLLNVRPTNMRYSFGLGMTESLHFKQLTEADYILTMELPDTLHFGYLNSMRVRNFLQEKRESLKIVNELNKTEQILLYRN